VIYKSDPETPGDLGGDWRDSRCTRGTEISTHYVPTEKQTANGPVRLSPWNPRISKLSMTEKGKVVADEPEEEEEYLQALIAKIEAQDDEVNNVSQAPLPIELPPYIPPWKGTAKIPKDLEATKSAL